jgi:2-dehydro-3-deoxygluconokinase
VSQQDPTITFVGEAMVELTSTSPHTIEWTFAGDALNAAAACANTSRSTNVRLLTGIGNDDLSDRLLERCRELGVDPGASPRFDDRTLGLYWIEAADGERRFRYWRDNSAARHALASSMLVPELAGATHIAWSGITLAVAGGGAEAFMDALAAARADGVTVCFDVNHRPALWPDVTTARRSIELAVAHADVVMASSDDVRALWSEDVAAFGERVLAAGAHEVIVSDGPSAVVCTTRAGTVMVHPEPTTVFDSAGAGDALWGTYLGRRCGGDDVESALRVAVAVARQAVRHRGALGYLDSRAG